MLILFTKVYHKSPLNTINALENKLVLLPLEKYILKGVRVGKFGQKRCQSVASNYAYNGRSLKNGLIAYVFLKMINHTY